MKQRLRNNKRGLLFQIFLIKPRNKERNLIMKNIQKITLITSLLATSLFISSTVFAESHAKKMADTTAAKTAKTVTTASKGVTKAQNKANKKAIATKKDSQEKLLKEVHKGVSEAFVKVAEATKLIAQGKEKEAIKALQEATGKFDTALAADPKLALIPISGNVNVSELRTTPEAVKAQVKLAQDFLEESKVQAARALLAPLQDDMVTVTTLLPMNTYPDAIKLATKLLVDGKKEEALTTLSTALSTIVQEISVIPLSLLRVESMVSAASGLDKEKSKDQALILLSAAEKQLQLATTLGYTDQNSDLYKDLSTQISALKKEITGGNVVEKLYSKLKNSIANLVAKKSKPTASK